MSTVIASHAGAVRIELASLAAVRVVAVVPCFNRRDDLRLLLNDLAGMQRRTAAGGMIDLAVVVVDNASTEPLSELGPVAGLDVEYLRLTENTGGSGGFNAGMRRGLERLADVTAAHSAPPGYLWLVDSDARVEPRTLAALVEALASSPDLCIAGSAIYELIPGRTGPAHPAAATGEPDPGRARLPERLMEVGGKINRRSGCMEPVVSDVMNAGAPGAFVAQADSGSSDSRGRELVPCDYAAACSLLVRAEAVVQAGLMPDLFLNCDDAAWCIRVARHTGLRVAGVRASRAWHPSWGRIKGWQRYYAARNAFAPLEELARAGESIGARVRLRRALLEVARGVGQTLIGRHDLAVLHLQGLRDAARGTTGRMPPLAKPHGPWAQGLGIQGLANAIRTLALEPGPSLSRGGSVLLDALSDLPASRHAEIRKELESVGLSARTPRSSGSRRSGSPPWHAALRFLGIGRARIAIISARGTPNAWFAGAWTVGIAEESWYIQPTPRWRMLSLALGTLARGCLGSLRVAGHRPASQ